MANKQPFKKTLFQSRNKIHQNKKIQVLGTEHPQSQNEIYE
jgi:hypothetical protein